MVSAGINGYISDVSENPNIRAKQLWQFLGGKILFRLSCLSKGETVCSCGIHTIHPLINLHCFGKPSKYSLQEYPCNIATDGYTYDYKYLKGCHTIIFSN